MACLAVHDKEAADEAFIPCFGAIEGASSDGRNYVKKAVNWALRQIGKRNARLRARAKKLATKLTGSETPSARWIGKDALREFSNKKARARRREST
jgi:3-methyladenine DNA glycosylase AlkD